MNKIKLKDYNESLGPFIDVNLLDNHATPNAIHIPYEDLIINHKEYLNKNKTYYIFCKSGIKARKAVNLLTYYGYNTIFVEK